MEKLVELGQLNAAHDVASFAVVDFSFNSWKIAFTGVFFNHS